MKTFTFAAIIAAASAQFGTTGHYGNAYSGPRNKEHAHVDHMYGYDSVPSRKDLKVTAGKTLNTTKLTAVKVKIEEANTARKNYF